MFVEYSKLVGYQKIFSDYLYDFEKVKKYFGKNFRAQKDYLSHFESILSARKNLQEDIRQYFRLSNSAQNISKLTSSNIELLNNPNTLVVLTEILPRLFFSNNEGIFKLISVIKLSAYLNENFPEYNFVPLAYLVTEENDFALFNKASFFDNSFEIKEIHYDDGLEAEENRGAIGKLKFENSIEQLLLSVREIMGNEIHEEAFQLLRESYKSGTTFAEAFKNIFSELFGKYGLLLFEDSNVEAKRTLKNIFARELRNHAKHTEKIIFTSAELEEKYSANLKILPINLAMHYDNGLHEIEPDDGFYRLHRKRKKFTQEELEAILESRPETFAPTAMLRTVCQSRLFPTAFVVASPFEVGNFAQIFPFFDFFQLPRPIVFPAVTSTFAEFDLNDVLEKYKLKIEDLLSEKEFLENKIKTNSENSELINALRKTRKTFETDFSFLMNRLAIRKNFNKEQFEAEEKKIREGLEKIENLIYELDKEEHQKTLAYLGKLRTQLLPFEAPQFLSINVFYYFLKYGTDLLPWLFEEIKINNSKHLILEL